MLLIKVKTRHEFASGVWFWLMSAGVLHGDGRCSGRGAGVQS